MSERPEGIAEGVAPRPRESAVVIVARQSAAGEWEVLLGLRSRRSPFFPSNWAFPGGAVESVDQPGRPGAHARCGARELHEETGISIPPEALVSIGFKTTPPFHPIRFRTEFFVTQAPGDVDPELARPCPAENEQLRFLTAREALAQWGQGALLFPPPLPPLLRVFARERSAPFEQLPRLLAVVSEYEERVPRIEFVPFVWMLPMSSATLPPATHTNVWLVGERELAVVDPGGAERYDLEHLALVIERRRRIGARPSVVLLTHHHRDHVAGAGAVAARFDLPIRAHPETATLLRRRGVELPVRGDLEDGAEVDLGGMTLCARCTPGHAPGHLVFQIRERSATLVGDLLSGFSSILIPPDDGDMSAYCESLARLRECEPGLLLPAHGPPLPSAALDAALQHRLQREDRVLGALAADPRPLADIAAAAYADAPDAPGPLTELQTGAHLLRLERLGRARRSDEPAAIGWALAGPSASVPDGPAT